MSQHESEPVTELDRPVVSLHSGERASDKLVLSRGRLYRAVERAGGYAVVTRGEDDLDPETGEFSSHYRIEDLPEDRQLKKYGAIAVSSMRDYSNRLETEHFPVLNPSPIREICRDKWRIYELAEGMRPESHHVDLEGRESRTEPQDLEELISSIPGNMIVAKPIRGRGSKNVHLGSKEEIHSKLLSELQAADDPNFEWIIQRALNTRQELPGIKATSDSQRAKLERVRGPKELRIFTVDSEPVLAVMRAAKEDNAEKMGEGDEWIYIDQDSVPEEALNQARHMVDAIRKATGQTDSYIAIDQVWDERWWLMEANHDPVIRNKKDPETGQWLEIRERAVGRKLVYMALRNLNQTSS